MKKLDNNINTILLIGSGPIIIGQACEFDYSGTQAAKTLKELGYRVILINSNPATIMTDPEFADKTYIEPIEADIISEIIKKEKVDAILPTMGGQTALNVAMKMHENGMLKDVKFLGANPAAIKKGEDRQEFKEAMMEIGMDLPKSRYAYNMEEAVEAMHYIGFPLMIRASYTMGGGGSGIAYNVEEFEEIASSGLDLSPVNEILIEESLLGWKEYEMEVIRDRADNCIIVCSIENVDPMGVHTGDSITVAPALTLTDKEYQRMRDASFAILREIGVDTGGSNVQFAINPKTGRMIVIEMNPRVSRSSALASKATGYPIAKVATLLAVGYTLDQITNDITGTTAAFEPVIDYIVTKIPRFTFEKFDTADTTLGTSMKSVGEAMAIGRTFKESFQKALCSIETDLYGFNKLDGIDKETLVKEIRRPNSDRILYIAQAFREGFSVDEIHEICSMDRWFLYQFEELIAFEKSMNKDILSDAKLLREAKTYGFSDLMISKIIDCDEEEVYLARKNQEIKFEYNEVDTCAAEFKSLTPYLYSSINISDQIINQSKEEISDKKKVLIIGGGPNRIGQGIEFDYCCVHASYALKDMDVTTLMYNCNPETVSTDYDTSDILYFEPIDLEHVRSVIDREKPNGIIVHFGGQTPLKLAKQITNLGGNIIGTSAEVIDLAEDRERFSDFVNTHNLLQPQNDTAFSKAEAICKAQIIGYPVLVRPSYVLGGRAMRVVHNEKELATYMDKAVSVSHESPVLLDKFLNNAIEIDVDAISDGEDVYVGGIMQHIEEAGIHSGDSACSLPTVSLSGDVLQDIKEQTRIIAINLGIQGLLNIQFAVFENRVYLIEVNPRASRTVPFVSKATGIPLAKVATRVMYGEQLKESLDFYNKFDGIEKYKNIYQAKARSFVSVKEAVFPFNKLLGADLILGPEMKSTGEVMGISDKFPISFAKSQLAVKNVLPRSGNIFVSLTNEDKPYFLDVARKYIHVGFKLLATRGTYEYLKRNDIECELVLKISEGRPNISDSLKNSEIACAINTSDARSSHNDAAMIRRLVLKLNIPYFTTIAAAKASIDAIAMINTNRKIYFPKSIQEYLAQV